MSYDIESRILYCIDLFGYARQVKFVSNKKVSFYYKIYKDEYDRSKLGLLVHSSTDEISANTPLNIKVQFKDKVIEYTQYFDTYYKVEEEYVIEDILHNDDLILKEFLEGNEYIDIKINVLSSVVGGRVNAKV